MGIKYEKIVYNTIKHIPGVNVILHFTGNTPYISDKLCTQQLGDIMNSPYRDIPERYQRHHPKDILTIKQATRIMNDVKSSAKKK